MYKSVLNGTLTQDNDEGNYSKWEESGGRETSADEKIDLNLQIWFANILNQMPLHWLKINSLIGKGCGQTSRIDALRQAIEKAKQFNFQLKDAVLASDAFFPFQ